VEQHIQQGARPAGQAAAISAALMWTLIGALGAIALAGIASIGIVLFPVAAVLAWIQISQRGTEQAQWSVFGVGGALVGVGLASLPYEACGSSGNAAISVSEVGETASYSCGGIHPAAPIVLGIVLMAVAIIAGRVRR
jgi:hypothetical protein